MTDFGPGNAPQVIPPSPYDGAAGLVHDLGNYIQIAMSAVRLVSRHQDAAGSVALSAMLAQADDALGRAGELVRYTVRGADDEDDIGIGECVMQVASLLRYATGPDVHVRLLLGLLPKVRISRVGLQNALLNLAVNARDAMPSGGTLAISAMLADGPDSAEIELVVADNGVGMAPETMQRAFEPRFSTKPTGSGIGLSGVRRFVEGYGGRIAIESAPGFGTTVRLRFPAG